MSHGDIILYHWQVGGLNLSITNTVVMLWVAAVLTFVVLFAGARLVRPTGEGRFANLIEALLDFLKENVTEPFLGHAGAKWFPFIASVFFFILFCNLLGLVPVPWFFKAPTSNINVTLPLALTVFAIVQVMAVAHHGPKYYLGLLFPKSAPAWLRFTLMPLIELISLLARPVSLAVRLFANLMAGHQIILTFLGGVIYLAGLAWYFKPIAALPLAVTVVMNAFELFVAFIQAFIFALLTALYLGEAMGESH
jgi:F-type H+-transporting ATPase subunit a